MSKEYKPSDKDIDSMMNYLRLTDPAHSTRQWALIILDHMHATLDRMSFDNPELLEKLIQDLKSKRKQP